MNEEQAFAAVECGVERIVALYPIAKKLEERGIAAVTLFGAIGAGTKATGEVMAMNTSQIYASGDKKIYGGFRLNVTNSETAEEFSALEAVTLSPELNLKEIGQITAKVRCEVFAYGRLPLMVMRNCPARACGECHGGGGYTLRDRRREEFHIQCGADCVSELLNSKPVYMADKMHELASAGVDGVQLWFYTESAAEVKKIIRAYKNGTPMEENSFTRGHFYRGVV